jgi:membrane associated rhomboid family serine protease
MPSKVLSEPKSRVVPFFIFINVCVFILWHWRYFSIEFMAENFLVSWEHLDAGLYWTLITSVFSHNMLLHIFINMYVLFNFGTLVEYVLGARVFTAFYLVAGVVSSAAHALTSKFIIGSPELPALGASGSIAGIVLLYSLLFPREKILIFGLVPVPAIFGAIAFIAIDVWGLIEQSGGGGLPIGHGAHLGGAVSGILFYLLFMRRRVRLAKSDSPVVYSET